MVGKKVNIFKTFSILLFSFTFCILLNCKEEKTELAYRFIERNSYFIDSYNGISVYRDNKTRNPMNGYIVVGDKLRKWEEFKLNNGILNGDYIVFHENGKMFSKTNYLNGKIDGDDKKYYLSGAIKTVDLYKNGVKYGNSKEYFESGQIRYESKIENEEVIESTTYDIIGNIVSQMFIKDGKTIAQNIKNGKVISEQISSNYDNFEAMKFYNEDGSLKVFLQMLNQDDKHYLIELNEEGNEIKRIDIKANPKEFFKYQQYFIDR
jgi:hypothetical protein